MEVSAKAKLAKATLASIIAISLSGCGGDSPEPPTNNAIVSLEQSDGNWTLYRYGEPYYVKGIGGQHALEFASAAGANSTRTWSSENAGNVLDQANELGMTVLLGIWLSHQASDYSNEAYKNSIRSELQQLLNNYSDHPALLMWGLGNEINLGADTQEAWEFVEELAQMVNTQDVNHPTMTVNAGASPNTLSNIAQWAPSIDVLGINSYGGVTSTDENVTASSFDGPYMITEWGPNGHWEVDATTWDQPIEQTSASKQTSYIDRYEYITSQTARCLGSYVFLWGQKQERTPTWYGMFAETSLALGLNGESYPVVDAMQYNWTGSWPENQAPVVTAMTINGQQAADSITIDAGQQVTVTISASDPDSDNLTYIWEVLEEPTVLGTGGGFEPRPPKVEDAINGSGDTVEMSIESAGEYRAFVYVMDGNNHLGSANIPFLVQ